MLLKTLTKTNRVSLKDYTEQEYHSILWEKNNYVLKYVHTYGEDYGGSQNDEEVETYYGEIPPEAMLVKDGKFVGVMLVEDFDSANGGQRANSVKDVKLLVSGGPDRVHSGSDFSNDDHSRWDYLDIYLVKRPDDKEENIVWR